MSSLLLEWVNVTLHQVHADPNVSASMTNCGGVHHVENFDKDLSNGVVFAHLLQAHGFDMENLHNLVNDTSVAAKVTNLELLTPQFAKHGIVLSTMKKRALVMEDRSAVLQILFEIKELVNRKLHQQTLLQKQQRDEQRKRHQQQQQQQRQMQEHDANDEDHTTRDPARQDIDLGRLDDKTKPRTKFITTTEARHAAGREAALLNVHRRFLDTLATQTSTAARHAKQHKPPPKSPARVAGSMATKTKAPLGGNAMHFDKQLDLEIHLRKFQMTQFEYEKQQFHTTQAQASSKEELQRDYMTFVRNHLHDKSVFFNEWDQQHQQEWKQTLTRAHNLQQAELALELTLQERKRLFELVRLTKSRHDAIDGIQQFEKNFKRLGLAEPSAQTATATTTTSSSSSSSSSTASTSGANATKAASAKMTGKPVNTAATTAGTAANAGVRPASPVLVPAKGSGFDHLRKLEQMVQEYDFRPSNNVRMMKELRERRRLQIQAEKERKIRRRKMLATQESIDEECLGGACPSEFNASHVLAVGSTLEMPVAPSKGSSTTPMDTACTTDPVSIAMQPQDASSSVSTSPIQSGDQLRETFFRENRAVLEANYDQLRALGTVKRQEANQTLAHLQLDHRMRAESNKKRFIDQVLNTLIDLSIDMAHSQPGAPKDRHQWLQKWHSIDMEVATKTFSKPEATLASTMESLITTCDETRQETTFLAHTLWNSFASHSAHFGDLVQMAFLTPRLAEIHWPPLDSFQVVCLFSSTTTEHSKLFAKKLAQQHHLHYLQLEELLEESVQTTIAASAPDQPPSTLREKELAAFGPKIVSLRNKNTPIAESLAVDIVMALIRLYHREDEENYAQRAAALSSIHSKRQSTPSISTMGDADSSSRSGSPRSKVGSRATTPPTPSSSRPRSRSTTVSLAQLPKRGCLLHNFPRSLEEMKLLDKALITLRMGSESENMDQVLQARHESVDEAFDRPEDVVPEQQQQQQQQQQVTGDPLVTPEDVASMSTTPAGQPVVVGVNPSPFRSQVDAVLLLAASEDHKDQSLEQIKSKYSRFSKVCLLLSGAAKSNRSELLGLELAHCAIELLTSSSFKNTVGVTKSTDPLFEAFREDKRQSLGVLDRIAYMKATGDLCIDASTAQSMTTKVTELENELIGHMEQSLVVVWQRLAAITSQLQSIQASLQDTLEQPTEFQRFVDALTHQLKQTTSATERDHVRLKMEIMMGDFADRLRHEALCWLNQLAQVSSATIEAMRAAVDQVIPGVCIAVVNYFRHKLQVYDDFYAQLTFLCANATHLSVDESMQQAALEAVTKLPQQEQFQVTTLLQDLTKSFEFVPVVDATSVALPTSLAGPRHAGAKANANSFTKQFMVSAEIRVLFEIITYLCGLSGNLEQMATDLVVNKQQQLETFVYKDLKDKYEAINQITLRANSIASASSAEHGKTRSWCLERSSAQIPCIGALAKCLSWDQQAALLTVAQLQILIQRLREFPTRLVPVSDMLEAILPIARQANFPIPWQTAASLANALERAAIQHESVVNWQLWVLSILEMEFLGVVTWKQLVRWMQQHVAKYEASTRVVNNKMTWQEFTSKPLWFESQIGAPPPNTVAGSPTTARSRANETKELSPCDWEPFRHLLFQLFQDGSDTIDMQTMLLSLCVCCWTSDAQLDISWHEVLAPHCRGLARAFWILGTLVHIQAANADSLHPGDGANGSSWMVVQLVPTLLELYAFCGLPSPSLTLLSALEEPSKKTWHQQKVVEFVQLCEELEPDLAKSFVLPNVFDALTEPLTDP